jgi:hypothetical protein
MKYIFFLFVFLLFIGFNACKNDGVVAPGSNVNENSNVKYPRFMVATRPGAYEPKGLRKLSVLEMKEMGQKGLIEFNFVCKDEKGNVVENDYYSKGSEPRFMQMYVNENDVVVEAVIMEMSDEIKSIMAMMRFVSL